jgi:tripartite ATP-independent transporter DctM subunit
MTLAGSLLLLGGFVLLLALGAPMVVALGVPGVLVIAVQGLGIMSVPTNAYAAVAKYPLLALPMFVLAGLILERAGVALRLVRLAASLVGDRRGALGVVAVVVCMFLGGISGSGPADAAAAATVLLPAMTRQGYPPAFSASLIAAAGSTAILIPPSVAFIIYAVLVPGAGVPALFAGGLIPGILAGLSLIVPLLVFTRRGGFGADAPAEQPPFWRSLREASWGLFAPVIILGGLGSGMFTPTEAGVVAAVYGLFVGGVIYRTLTWRMLYEVFAEAAEISAVVLVIISLAAVFAHAGSTVGAFDAFAKGLIGLAPNEAWMLVLVTLMLLIAGMLLDAVSIYFVFLPILLPIMAAFQWHPVWFGVVMTMNLAIGQFTPPMAVNLMVTTKIAGVGMESTVRWVVWMVAAMVAAMALVIVFPELVLWLPRRLGYL